MINNVDDHVLSSDNPTSSTNNPTPLIGPTGGTIPSQEITVDPSESLTAQGAANLLNVAEQFIAHTRQDVLFAEERMNTDKIDRWLADAEALLAQANAAFAAHAYTQAAAYVAAARTLAGTTRMLISQTLGINNLPSYAQNLHNPLYTPEWWLAVRGHFLTKPEVRAELTEIHSNIMRRDPLPEFEKSGGASTYLAEALNAYKAAHAAYIDGNYSAASDAGWLAQGLLRVADLMVKTVTPDTSHDTPSQLRVTSL